MTCLIASKSKDIVVAFKKELLTCCLGTDEGEVTEYLGCELLCTVPLKRQKTSPKGIHGTSLRDLWNVGL